MARQRLLWQMRHRPWLRPSLLDRRSRIERLPTSRRMRISDQDKHQRPHLAQVPRFDSGQPDRICPILGSYFKTGSVPVSLHLNSRHCNAILRRHLGSVKFTDSSESEFVNVSGLIAIIAGPIACTVSKTTPLKRILCGFLETSDNSALDRRASIALPDQNRRTLSRSSVSRP